jgi:hypothetical protein
VPNVRFEPHKLGTQTDQEATSDRCARNQNSASADHILPRTPAELAVRRGISQLNRVSALTSRASMPSSGGRAGRCDAPEREKLPREP